MICWFAETTLVAAILAGAAAVCGRSHTLNSTARHLLWLVVLIKLITPPVIQSPWTFPSPLGVSPEVETSSIAIASASLATAPPAADLVIPGSTIETTDESTLTAIPNESASKIPATVGQPESRSVPDPSSRRAMWSWLPGRLGGRSFSVATLPLSIWVLGTLALILFQGTRIVAFRKRLLDAVPAPSWLVAEAEQLAERLQVRVPELLVIAGLGTPMLWCLGRPKLLLPAHLLKSIEVARWRGILAHELAHLRRGDQWVGRIELVAGLLWWWNPIYWLTCRRLEAESELACDAWVVWALPHERLNYAEVLFHVCSQFSRAGSPSPTLGVAGSGRFFERRLSMILHERASCRVSPPILLAVGLLAALSLPSWTFATPSGPVVPGQDSASAQAVSSPRPSSSTVVDDKDDDDRDDAEAIDDADDDDKDAKGARADSAAKDKEKSKTSKSAKGDVDVDIDLNLSGFEKNIEAWAEKFSKEIEEKFGDNSEFVKKMEALGDEMEKKFGENSEFAKKMEAFGKEMEKKFGEDSEFTKKMEAFGKEMEKKVGPGSDFEKKIKEKLGPGSDFEKKIKEKLGPGSDFEKKMKSLGKDSGAKGRKAGQEVRNGAEQAAPV